MKKHQPHNRLPTSYEKVGDRVAIFLRGKTWYANFQHEGKQHRPSLRTASKKEARRKAIKLEAELIDGRFQERRETPTIDEAISTYEKHLRTEGRAEKTLVKYAKVFERVRALAKRRKVTKLSQVGLPFMDAYRSMRVDDGAAPKTVYTESVILRQLVKFAHSRGMLAKDPLQGCKLAKPKPTPQPCWTMDQVETILSACKDAYRPVFTLLAETGMRINELAHLGWDDVDETREVFLIRPKDDWKPKSGDQRAVPISARAAAVLRKLPRHTRWVVTAPPTKQHPGSDRPVSDRRALAALKRVLKRLHLPGHLHTFRHAFISNALTKGVPEAVVRSWVGHVDEEILKLYTHVADQQSQEAMARLNKANEAQKAKEAKGDNDEESEQI